MQTYLTKYGYAPPENLVSAGGVARQTSMREAIMEMQAFMGLKKTGELDEATLAVMRKSRCANSDKVSSYSHLHYSVDKQPCTPLLC